MDTFAGQGMPRYLYYFSFSLGAGSLASLPFAAIQYLPSFAFALFSALFLIGALFLLKDSLGKWLVRVCVCTALAVLGATISHLTIQDRIEKQIPNSLAGEDFLVKAKVVGLVERDARGFVFDAWVSEGVRAESGERLPESMFSGKVRLRWYVNGFAAARTHEFKVGEVWQLVVRVKRPRGLVNPGGFDYQAWMLAQGYVASGYIREAQKIDSELKGMAFGVRVNKWREYFIDRLFSAELRQGAILRALLLGDKSQISQSEWSLMQNTGTVHLMAISGLHIGLFAGLAFFLGHLLARLLPGARAMLWLPASFSIVAAVLYSALAGFALPTQRALVLVVLFSLSRCFGMRVNFFTVLSIAAVIVLILDPFACLSPGFWLSFGAVFILVVGLGLERKSGRVLSRLLVAQCIVFVGMLLPLSALGLPVSLIAPLANIVAIPLISFVLVPGLFLSAFASLFSENLAELLVQFCDATAHLLWLFLELVSRLPAGSVWFSAGQAFWLTIPLSLVALVLILSPRGLGLRYLGVLFAVILLAPIPKQNTLQIRIMDVGQGLAVVVELQNYLLIYDTGDKFSDKFDIGSGVLSPYLRRKGIRNIDHLIVSHGDSDHIGGLESLLSAFDVQNFFLGPDIKDPYLSSEICRAGYSWREGALIFTFLHPSETFINQSETDNNLSCVLLLEYHGFKMLLPGDIEKKAENALVASSLLPKIDVLLAPHHGSRTSSTPSFLAALEPELVVFSAGFKNRYRHPSAKIVQRYQHFGIESLNTANNGAITLFVDQDGTWIIRQEREFSTKLWFEH